MIREVKVQGKDLIVYYESNAVRIYRKPQDIGMLKGVRPITKALVKWMNENPSKVR